MDTGGDTRKKRVHSIWRIDTPPPFSPRLPPVRGGDGLPGPIEGAPGGAWNDDLGLLPERVARHRRGWRLRPGCDEPPQILLHPSRCRSRSLGRRTHLDPLDRESRALRRRPIELRLHETPGVRRYVDSRRVEWQARVSPRSDELSGSQASDECALLFFVERSILGNSPVIRGPDAPRRSSSSMRSHVSASPNARAAVTRGAHTGADARRDLSRALATKSTALKVHDMVAQEAAWIRACFHPDSRWVASAECLRQTGSRLSVDR
jgi:hypothetical protein